MTDEAVRLLVERYYAIVLTSENSTRAAHVRGLNDASMAHLMIDHQMGTFLPRAYMRRSRTFITRARPTCPHLPLAACLEKRL
jgi:hypothetical protein